MEKSRTIGVVAPAESSLNSSAPGGKDWRGLMWIALLVLAIAASALQAMP